MIQVGLFLLLVCIAADSAGATGPAAKGCSATFKAVTNFDAKKIAGVWHEVRQIFSSPGREGTCGAVKYTANADGTVKVDVIWLDLKGKPGKQSGMIKNAGAKTVGSLIITVEGKTLPYTIFYLNYDAFFGIHACVNGKDDVWVFAKKESATDTELAPIKTAMTGAGLDAASLKPTVRKGCPTF